MLCITDLCVEVDGVKLLDGLNLEVDGGVHAIMGPNGAGKSTLAKVLAGHPAYQVTHGEVLFKGQDLLALEPEARAHAGLFMGFQYPIEIPGVSNREFLRAAYNATRKSRGQVELDQAHFDAYLEEKMALLAIKEDLKERNVNEGFSGGEKKRNEILQMAVLDPDCAILDEADSGLDIDAIRAVAQAVNRCMTPEKSLILVTHYQRILDYIKPTVVHAFKEGRIVRTAGPELALELEERGYDWL